MWSLPDIRALNHQAKLDRATIEMLAKAGVAEDGSKLECLYSRDECEGQLHTHLYFDIFSDDPKGTVTVCEKHDGYYGSPAEGYFYCDDCGRVFIENYTWELYSFEGVCLNCYRKSELRNPDNWIDLRNGGIEQLTFEQVRKAKHLLAVGQDTPKSLKFIGNAEMDGSTGGELIGFSSCASTPDSAVERLCELLRTAKDRRYKRAILILNGGYQFSVSVGVYAERQIKARKSRPKSAPKEALEA
jgi:hypothetical protein